MSKETAPMKTCTQCGETLPSTAEFFHKKAPFRLYAECKVCINKRNKSWYESNRERKLQNDKKRREANRRKAFVTILSKAVR